jgi:hypothetical protein
MILVPSWSAKGEGRVSRIRKLETGKYKESMLVHYERSSDGHIVGQGIL